MKIVVYGHKQEILLKRKSVKNTSNVSTVLCSATRLAVSLFSAATLKYSISCVSYENTSKSLFNFENVLKNTSKVVIVFCVRRPLAFKKSKAVAKVSAGNAQLLHFFFVQNLFIFSFMTASNNSGKSG